MLAFFAAIGAAIHDDAHKNDGVIADKDMECEVQRWVKEYVADQKRTSEWLNSPEGRAMVDKLPPHDPTEGQYDTEY